MSDQYDEKGDIQAAPLGDGDNLFDWHFTIRGPSDSPFEDGIYHGRLIFPPQYPMKPPEIFLLTPNGRFETNKKICLSISGYHPETWLPSWSISTALRALQAFFCTPAKGAIGGLEWPEAERRRIAKKSPEWKCGECGCMKEILHERALNQDVQNNNKIEESKPEPDTHQQQSEEKPQKKKSAVCTEAKDSEANQQSRERRRIEQAMIQQQIDYQKSDMWSIVFMVFIFVCIGLLLMRKYSKSSTELEL